ncbi:MAG: S1 RNA-binding domain-containing protein [Candidatus Portnoybacteria bacterium]|nr:S1 RNA-binding domain-containing protein [Candidatus Portnoybacteria bacterium]
MDVDITKLLKDDEASKHLFQPGKEVEGNLVGRDRTKLYVDLSPFGTGVIYKVDFTDSPLAKTTKALPIGTQIKARVVDPENEEGFIELSLKELSQEVALDELAKKAQLKEILAGKVVDANKGGLMVQVEGILGFLPSSQLAQNHYPRAASGEAEEILKKLQALIGKELSIRILTVDPKKQTLIISEKAATEGDLRKKLEHYTEGDIVEGEVTGITNFGAFVRFGEGLEGLVHISELDWRLISHPQEVVKVGDKVKAKIIKIEHNEVSLSLKALKKDAWEGIEEKYPVGTNVKAVVKELHPFGAFAFLNDQIHGLVHISQFGSQKRMGEVLKAGKEYVFEIISLQPKNHRMGLKLITEKPKTKPRPRASAKKKSKI